MEQSIMATILKFKYIHAPTHGEIKFAIAFVNNFFKHIEVFGRQLNTHRLECKYILLAVLFRSNVFVINSSSQTHVIEVKRTAHFTFGKILENSIPNGMCVAGNE